MIATKSPSILGTSQRSVNFGPFTSKGVVQRFYDNINQDLDNSDAGEDAYFMNLGYIHDGSPSFSIDRLSPRTFDRESHQLLLEVIGDCDMTGKSVLEVGCGRGGAAHVLEKHFQTARYLGLDISEKAIHFCQSTHRKPNFDFVQGDAESLNVPPDSVDVLLNVESSHNYPDICAFYQQANLALKPGGYFLYADSMLAESMSANVAKLRQAGFVVQRQLDITANIMRACEAVASKRRRLFVQEGRGGHISNFLAAPGSEVFGAYRRGELQYWVFKLRKDL